MFTGTMLRKTRNKAVAAATLVTTMVMTGCHDFNYYDPDTFVKDYANNWEEQFGKVDSEQDWNVATRVEAVVSVTGAGVGSRVNIYSDNPYEKEAFAYAQYTIGEDARFSFDVEKGMQQVYAMVIVGGRIVVQGYYDIADGVVAITGQPVAKRLASPSMMRAPEICNVTVGRKIDLGCYRDSIVHEAVVEKNWDGKTYVNWNNGVLEAYYKLENGSYYRSTDLVEWKLCTFDNPYYPVLYCDGVQTPVTANPDGSGFYNVQDGDDHWGLRRYYTETEVQTGWVERFPYGDFYELDGVAGQAGQSWKQGVGYGLYGTGKFFAEYVKYWEKEKTSLEGYDISKIEQGASVTTATAGPLTLSFVYGATQNANAFGYFYYTDEKDKATAPRYILIKDARPGQNIYHDSWKGIAVGDMELSVWSNYERLLADKDREPYDWEIMQNRTPMQLYIAAYNKQFVGTDYKMVYFGEGYDQPGSYTFPANVHVEFFIINIGNASSPDYKTNLGNFNYGTPELNRQMGHYSMRRNFDTNYGAMKATTWKYNGVQYIGFEDGGGDEDLNDIVFVMDGDVDDTDDIIDVPSDEPVVEDASWIVACEDLGSTDDYDFNDVVFKVSHAAGSGVATVTPLAAGGTLPASIYHEGSCLGEIHSLINPYASTSVMINTTSKGQAGAPVSISVPASFSMVDNMGNFSIYVEGQQALTISSPSKGTVPQMICVPGSWAWPKEREAIEKAYPRFVDWSQNAGQNTDWYQTCDTDKVVK